MDDSALRFAGEFYRALTDGYSAETAVVEGRKALAIRGWDWSAYVTYTGPGVRLEELRTRRCAPPPLRPPSPRSARRRAGYVAASGAADSSLRSSPGRMRPSRCSRGT